VQTADRMAGDTSKFTADPRREKESTMPKAVASSAPLNHLAVYVDCDRASLPLADAHTGFEARGRKRDKTREGAAGCACLLGRGTRLSNSECLTPDPEDEASGKAHKHIVLDSPCSHQQLPDAEDDAAQGASPPHAKVSVDDIAPNEDLNNVGPAVQRVHEIVLQLRETREAFEKGFLERSRNIVAVVGPESDHAAQEENSVAVEEALRV